MSVWLTSPGFHLPLGIIYYWPGFIVWQCPALLQANARAYPMCCCLQPSSPPSLEFMTNLLVQSTVFKLWLQSSALWPSRVVLQGIPHCWHCLSRYASLQQLVPFNWIHSWTLTCSPHSWSLASNARSYWMQTRCSWAQGKGMLLVAWGKSWIELLCSKYESLLIIFSTG